MGQQLGLYISGKQARGVKPAAFLPKGFGSWIQEVQDTEAQNWVEFKAFLGSEDLWAIQ